MHVDTEDTDGVLCHPADSQAWRTIDEKFPEIAEDTRNLRLGISADGVDVNTGNRHHSVWPVLTVIYNLPPWLWVDTYDASTKDNFNLRAVVLWTINDYPALGTYVVCPTIVFKGFVNGKDTNCDMTFCRYPSKMYSRTQLHVLGKKKDVIECSMDLAEFGGKTIVVLQSQAKDKTTLPPAGYTLTNAEKDIFCEMLHNIKVPEGYCSNFSSLVNLKDRKLIGLKSHDYHMLMQEFLPIAIRSIMHPPTQYAIIRRHKQVLKTENPGKRIAFLENEHSKSFAKWLREEVERELAIDKESCIRNCYGYLITVSVKFPLFKCDWLNTNLVV
ncbi:hypothetical protein Tco_0772780 [Tanacetum coccineum]|uniref:Uncharacterized protein n=1 Tax=Tanacetum coccineum TaxID=301880 RepID=A0ABQ4ZIV0_9ASTR